MANKEQKLNPRKILEQVFKEHYPDNWETELRDFEHGFSGWYEVTICAMYNILNAESAKSPFPIERLKAWLEEDTKRHEIGVVVKSQGKNCFEGFADNLSLSQIIQIIRLAFDMVSDKIAEIETQQKEGK